MNSQRVEPDAAYVDIGMIKALLSERCSSKPSDFENAARIFLLTIIGKYEPPEELAMDATDEERLKYRWGHQALDVFKRRMRFESKTVNAKRVRDGQRSNYVRQLVRAGYERDDAWVEAWKKFPKSSEDSDAGEIATDMEEVEMESPQAAGKGAARSPRAKGEREGGRTAKPVEPPSGPDDEDALAVLPAGVVRHRKEEEAQIAKWNKKFPNADVLRDHLKKTLGTRLNSELMRLLISDPNCAVDVYNKLVETEWRSNSGKVLTYLTEVAPWYIMAYKKSLVAQKRVVSEIEAADFSDSPDYAEKVAADRKRMKQLEREAANKGQC